MGDRGAHLRLGVEVMSAGPWRLSPVYETAPWGGVDQDDFWNLVLEVETNLPAHSLLERALAVEAVAKRTREVHWGPRTLDVDLLLLGDEVHEEPALLVPHPRLWERRFVLAPLRDLRPDLVTEAALAASNGEVRFLGTLESLL